MKNQVTVITGPIKDGRTGFTVQINTALKSLEGKRARIVIEEFKLPRTTPQNNYYYGVVLTAYQEKFAAEGVIFSKEQMHLWIKEFVWKWFVDVELNGIPFRKILSSTEVNIQQWEDLMKQCRYYADKHLNIYIPEPQKKLPDYMDIPSGVYYDYEYKNYFKIIDAQSERVQESNQLAIQAE